MSFSEKQAIVTYDPRQASVDDMIQAVKRAGFQASETTGRWVCEAQKITGISPGIDWEKKRMAKGSSSLGDKCFKTGLWGSIIAAICCFTPVLVIALGFVGLAAITPYLDYVLFPLLGLFLILAFYGWRVRKGKVSERNSSFL